MVNTGSDSGTILGVCLLLFAFGAVYNAFVGWAQRRGYTEGYLSLVVAFGVGVTLAGVSILSMEAALLSLLGFAASGTPMIVGSIWRHLKQREEAKRAMLAEIER